MQELQELVAGADQVKALASRHSFNDIPDTAGTLAILDRLDESISVDVLAMIVPDGGSTRTHGVVTQQVARGSDLPDDFRALLDVPGSDFAE
ncbi:hypothetical protein QFZ79_002609 [Arthrobacter sp. V4I6]|uniref:hypothetical protein n=1 Tax=unclassified Arthrobacter TaxID=235627 RepID=UPI00278046B1|nr:MULTISPECIES: hypothetical protein [unclassified Arthrobacter]MDQ0820316.1 hypothetical protein [Arthrobacter sp. V1I7]MDQ0854498.1 hypothetical protein [Arthrobacter sp. V4I6]